ncbi:Voltage-dependent T-type calcium channel subunit alpha-1G (Voltage-gated calcium channel subunit alpha Cav3.1) [Durusdinium trenchii]|uniref:Voltage-dependent T-type calcium channel subunit alpha-1G (Voltage-gated calcium channel subunit alpha Cav3.1) n=1 Tax=Durusdinium trenchii TaxID=1381693 RepID=A0ABP0SMP0_9DINO
MSWIQKTVNPLVNQPDSGEASPVTENGEADVNWTKEDKDKALNAAEEYQKGGMLSQLNQDLAKKNVRKRAAHASCQIRLYIGFSMLTPRVEVRMGMHPWFERATMAMIFMNAVWISVDIEFNDADILAEADAGFIVVENLFCTFFTCELILRYSLFTRTWFALQDPWFMFDVFLLILMVFETWLVPIAHLLTSKSGNSMTGGASVLRVARVLRVLRTARMARLVRFMPELMILIKGMMVACRSVFFTLVLLLLFTYVFSVAFVQFSRGTALEGQFFGSMGTAIWTLILKCILTDQQFIIEAVAQESWIMAIMVLFFILFGSLTVMNMLLGVLVEAIKTVSTIEREQLEVDFAKKCLWEMIDKGQADQDGDNRISEEEYRNVLRTPQAMAALTSLGVDVEAALDYGRLLFEDGEPLTFGDFMRGILTLRGSNQTTVKDIVDLRKFTADEFSHIHEVLNGICKFLVTGPCGAGASVSFFSGVGGGRRWSKRSWVRGSELKGRVRGLWPINVGVEELCGSFFRDSGQRSCQA